MILQNLHTHTLWGDGKNSAEEMILSAITCGCTSIGFSEHAPLPPACNAEDWALKDAGAYHQELLALREKYQGRVDVFLGLEQDGNSPPPEHPWDYLIGSSHSIWVEGVNRSVDHTADITRETIETCFAGDPYAYTAAYFREIGTIGEKTGCQIVGHFDLAAKFNEGGCMFDETHPRYVSAALEAMEHLAKQDLIFEINTGAVSRGYRSVPYPSALLLKKLRELGGRICITSDSHSTDTIIYGFRQAEALARACGFQETWVLTKDGFIPQKI